jgi:hypothetical protein
MTVELAAGLLVIGVPIAFNVAFIELGRTHHSAHMPS